MSIPALVSSKEEKHVHFAEKVESRTVVVVDESICFYFEYSLPSVFIEIADKHTRHSMNKRIVQLNRWGIERRLLNTKTAQKVAYSWAKMQHVIAQCANWDKQMLNSLSHLEVQDFLKELNRLYVEVEKVKDSYTYTPRRYAKGYDLIEDDIEILLSMIQMIKKTDEEFKAKEKRKVLLTKSASCHF
ncbi:MAG: hypothetical protein WD595_06375 [Waddliaceae bacterium]